MKENMKNLIIIISLVGALLTGCSTTGSKKEWEVTISGRFEQIGSGKLSLQSWADTLNTTIPVEFNSTDKTFTKTLKISEPGFYRLFLFDQAYADLILFKNNIQVNVNASNQTRITGSPEMELIYRIDSLRATFDETPDMIAINEEFAAAVDKNDENAIEEIRDRYKGLLDAFNEKISSELIASSPSIGVIQLLSGNTLDREQYFKTYEQVAEKFTGEWRDYSLVKEFEEKVRQLKKTAIGSPAPEIHLPDPQGKFMKLSDFRGKFVLVDFWAKWCGPCRRENPNLVNAYNRFKGPSFEVIGVSLDRNKEDWLQAIAEDGLTWVHLSDLRYFESVAAQDYNINAIPYSVLIDPKGIIVAKNLRGQELHRTLEKFLTP